MDIVGTAVYLYGTNNIANKSGMIDPSWECFVDNISIQKSSPYGFANNDWQFCGQDALVDGVHTLTVNATVMQSQTFWVDNIQYVPSASVPLDNKAISIDNTDPELHNAFGGSWGSTVVMLHYLNLTQTTNSTFTYDFNGK